MAVYISQSVWHVWLMFHHVTCFVMFHVLWCLAFVYGWLHVNQTVLLSDKFASSIIKIFAKCLKNLFAIRSDVSIPCLQANFCVHSVLMEIWIGQRPEVVTGNDWKMYINLPFNRKIHIDLPLIGKMHIYLLLNVSWYVTIVLAVSIPVSALIFLIAVSNINCLICDVCLLSLRLQDIVCITCIL